MNLTLGDGTQCSFQVLKVDGLRAIAQVFEGTSDITNRQTKCGFTGNFWEMSISEYMLGRSFHRSGKFIYISPKVIPEASLNINVMFINPSSRNYPKATIQTGISTIDAMSSFARG